MITEDKHTKEFDEVMRRPPNYITRNGHWILLVLLALLVVLACLYRERLF